jgi:hypothetical protein
VALETHSKIHLCHLLLPKSIERAVCFGKVEGIEAQETAHSEQLGRIGGCRKGKNPK